MPRPKGWRSCEIVTATFLGITHEADCCSGPCADQNYNHVTFLSLFELCVFTATPGSRKRPSNRSAARAEWELVSSDPPIVVVFVLDRLPQPPELDRPEPTHNENKTPPL